jgi:hypothetical protein
MPVEQMDRFDLVINRKTAQALGLTIPPALEAMAEMIRVVPRAALGQQQKQRPPFLCSAK